jgi:hypothetical protein
MTIYQGDKKGCVACSIAYLCGRSDWQSLFEASGDPSGSYPIKSLNLAKKWGWIKWWLPIPSFLARFVGRSLPVLIGVPMNRLVWSGTDKKNPIKWQLWNDENHMVVLIGQTENGDMEIVSWDDPEKQDIRILERSYPVLSAYILKQK